MSKIYRDESKEVSLMEDPAMKLTSMGKTDNTDYLKLIEDMDWQHVARMKKVGNTYSKATEQKIVSIIPKLNDASVKAAKPQSIEPESLESTRTCLGVSESFREAQEEDGKYMKAVKQAYDEYLSTDPEMLLNAKEKLDNLISACRWYNITHWSVLKSARLRQQQVKTILSHAKEERAKVEEKLKLNEKDEKAFKKEVKAEKKKYSEASERHIKLIANEEVPDDPTDQAGTSNSRLWAMFKGWTFGFFGRNILNIGMGALGGAAWLVTWPFGMAYGALTGQVQKYKKGLHIPIAYPMSPIGWTRYYYREQRHVMMTMRRASNLMVVPMVIGKAIQYNLWDPIKHVLTFDMKHLAGGAYINKSRKLERGRRRAEVEYQETAPYDARIDKSYDEDYSDKKYDGYDSEIDDDDEIMEEKKEVNKK